MAKKIVFCLPGPTFSREFVQNWSNTLSTLSRLGYHVQASFAYDPNVFYARTKCLCAQTTRGVDQKPFDGKIDYDIMFWVDSDILFDAEQVVRLINHDVDIVSGVYIMHDNQHYPIVDTMDHAYFLKHGHYAFWDRKRLTELQEKGNLVPVDYIGFGFMCIKKGVFERMKYPFFSPRLITFDTDNVREWASEDVSWCMTVRETLGLQVLVDPKVVVGHQKLMPLA